MYSPVVGKTGFDHKRAKDEYIPENIFYRLAIASLFLFSKITSQKRNESGIKK